MSLEEAPHTIAVAPVAAYAQDGGPAPGASPGGDRTLLEYLRIVHRSRWLVASIIAAALATGAAYLVLATPVYRSVALVQVEDGVRSAVLDDLSTVLGSKVPAETEVEIIRSRSLLGGVVDDVGLERTARARTFPIVGDAVMRRHRGDGVARAPFGLRRYAWGGERLRLERLAVSDDLVGAPITLTALGEGRFRLSSAREEPLGEGRVDEAVRGGAGRSTIELYVSELVAEPGTEFVIAQRQRERVIQQLQGGLHVHERGKKTGILVLEYEGREPRRIAEVLDAVANRYLRQNVERRSAEAAKTLEFLETQLPTLKANLDVAEARLNAYQVRRGTVSLSLETQSLLQRSVEVERALSDLEIQRAELRQRFSGDHPALAALTEKADRLRSQRELIEQRLRTLPDTELDSARLARDVKVSNELYAILLNKAQELRILKSGTIGNVRILDHALLPLDPVLPNRRVVLALSLVAGVSLAFTGAFARAMLRTRLDDPVEIERVTGLPVYAAIPHSDTQAALGRAPARVPPSAVVAPAGDPVAESFRGLRASLQFAVAEERRNVVVVSGPTPEVGKSFVARNLAFVLAAAEYRVVLVDGDLRRGSLHRTFGVARSPGVTEVVGEGLKAAGAIRTTEQHGLDFLPTGRIAPNPSELLNSRRFTQLLAELGARYDFVVVDSPPVLAVADVALIARASTVNVLVLRSGRHRLSDVLHALRVLSRHGVRVNGLVLNDVRLARGRYGASGRYRVYDYRSHA